MGGGGEERVGSSKEEEKGEVVQSDIVRKRDISIGVVYILYGQ